MRYTTEYKQQARAKLVAAAGQHAKQHGFASSGMADLAAAAGVTTGSLYKHFSGKSGLFAAIVSAELQRTADLYGAVGSANLEQATRALAGYLSLGHVQQAGAGCPLPALTPEIGRADTLVQQAFDNGVQSIHAKVQNLAGDADSAWVLMAQNVGAVMLARAMHSEALQSELLSAVQRAGEQLISAAPHPSCSAQTHASRL